MRHYGSAEHSGTAHQFATVARTRQLHFIRHRRHYNKLNSKGRIHADSYLSYDLKR